MGPQEEEFSLLSEQSLSYKPWKSMERTIQGVNLGLQSYDPLLKVIISFLQFRHEVVHHILRLRNSQRIHSFNSAAYSAINLVSNMKVNKNSRIYFSLIKY